MLLVDKMLKVCIIGLFVSYLLIMILSTFDGFVKESELTEDEVNALLMVQQAQYARSASEYAHRQYYREWDEFYVPKTPCK